MRQPSVGLAQMFSDPSKDRGVMQAWERFLRGDDQATGFVRQAVDTSWQRCLSGRVDPGQRYAPPPMSESLLQQLQAVNGELMRISAPAMSHAREFLAETGSMMALTDAQGVILALEGDPRTIDRAHSIRLEPGALWTELSCGTNAIGTALATGQPVQIHSAEHYCEGIKRWTCSGTVIRHPFDGEILGVIDVSGLSESYSRYSLGLAITTAARIESRLTAHEMELRYRLLEAAIGQLSASGSDGLILFDHRGSAIKANAAAYRWVEENNGQLDLSHPSRIEQLDLRRGRAGQLAGAEHAWIRAGWLQPVMHRGERVGTFLVLPAPRAKDKPRLPKQKPEPFSEIVCCDPALQAVVAQARRLARSHAPILLTGETGVGKEVFAQNIHLASPVDRGPFVALNCGGLSRELLASELFGYAEGAFTGARKGGQSGKIEAAASGTLFLDEIGEMPLDLQPHLLRVLEQGEIYRLGENSVRKVKFRLIAATHRDLRQEVAAGRFRMDLYYRIAVTSLRIPPLRERQADIAALVMQLTERVCRENDLPPRHFDEGALRCLESYTWPGNVRELRNVVENVLLVSSDETITIEQLPPELTRAQVEPIVVSAEPATLPQLLTPEQALLELPTPVIDREVEHSLEVAEQKHIRAAIHATGGNLSAAAKLLGIAKSTMYLKLRKHGLKADVDKNRHGRSVD